MAVHHDLTDRADLGGLHRPADDRWVTLERSVAAGMILTVAFIMTFVARAFVPPLAVVAVLFAIPLGLTAWRRRGPAIAVGVLASVWLASQIANAAMVVPDLADPADTVSFVATSAFVAVPIAGVVGLVGLLRRASATAATRVLQTTAAVLVLVVGVGVVAGLVAGDAPTVVTEGPATVTMQGNEFQPANVQVPVGATVTWEWADGEVSHDVVAERFASELKADGTFSHTFDEAGTYAYVCSVHPAMTGSVIVAESDGGAS